MTPAQRKKLDAALAVLRDPDGTGRTKVSHGFGSKLVPVKCFKPVGIGRCVLDTGHDGECDAEVRP